MKKIALVIIFFSSLNCTAQWTHHNPGTTDYISDVDFVSDQVGFAEDWDNGMLWGTTDGGDTWTMLLNNTPVYYMNFISADTGFTASTGMYRTIDGGHFWDPVISDSAVGWWSRPVFLNHQLGYTVQSSHRQGAPLDSFITYVTHDGGTNWNTVSSLADSNLYLVDDVFFYDSLLGFFSSGPRVYKTVNGGYNWSLILADDNEEYMTCFFTSPDTGFLGTLYSGDILRTTDGGLTWLVALTPISTPVYSIKFITDEIGYACGGDGFSSGFIIKTVDRGQLWTLDYGDNFTYNALSFPSKNFGYACGIGGSVVRNFLDDGVSGQQIKPGFEIYPNPTKGKLSITNLQFDPRGIEVYNMVGENVLKSKHVSTSNSRNLTFDISSLPAGVYIVQLSSQEKVWRGKVVKE